jgi:hypothetical protein
MLLQQLRCFPFSQQQGAHGLNCQTPEARLSRANHGKFHASFVGCQSAGFPVLLLEVFLFPWDHVPARQVDQAAIIFSANVRVGCNSHILEMLRFSSFSIVFEEKFNG